MRREGGIARGDESTWRAPGENCHRGISFTQRRHPSRGLFANLGCSPISTVHSIQTHTHSGLHSVHSQTLTAAVVAAAIVTESTPSQSAPPLSKFALRRPSRRVSLHLPCTCVRTCLCVRAYLSTLSAQRSSLPPWNCHFFFWHVGSCASSFVHLLHPRRPKARRGLTFCR